MIHTDEDDEFDRIARENAMKGQPYHFKKREWVELTKGEIETLPDNLSKVEFAWLVETKLREKNEKT
jgi:hypothetical protein